MPRTSLERLGAIAGLIFFVLVIANFSTPETPDVDDPSAQIVRELADDRGGHIASVYISGLASFAFIAFTAGLWSRLRRAEPEHGASLLTLLGGLGSAIIILVANGVYLALVYAADEGREPEAVRALLELDETVFLGIAFTSAAFYAGVAVSARATGSLPAWLAWTAAALAVLFPIAALAIFSEDDEGGVFGGIFFAAFIVNFLWVLAASIVMLRDRPRAAPAAVGPAP